MSNDQTLVDMNNAMEKMLRAYVNEAVAIRFDLPDVHATVSVFLYDIHEDLQLRTAESRGFNAGAGRLSPGWVNVKCNYLITYWESTGPATDAGNPDSQPDNQVISVL
ncbi:Pvc16 family protein [Chania multitudinisentens]|uniref:Pvc16 family protein n=1 Tax=Chania multitudinisentens TaxID=1639108 RepID=UPI0003E15014|nr:Pvc16 family protein [Chania multitudinisentens]